MEERVKDWLKEPFDTETQAQVQALLATNPQELREAFSGDLSFGTGGLRGIMGVGTNRMNRYTVRRTTLGLANYLKQQWKEPIFVVIGFDSRHHSQEFAKEAADSLVLSGIHVFLFKELRPTPFISFACRHLKAQAAIMITASHNPKQYNGYKVYWQDGAQVVSPHDTGILEEIKKISGFALPTSSKEGTLQWLDSSLDAAYLEAIRPLQNKRQESPSLRIAYTPLHGTGITLVPQALKNWGFSPPTLVEEQCTLDGDFPSVKVPNPEYLETLEKGIKTLLTSNSDILLATDPDADRLAVVVNDKGHPVPLTGNEIACVALEYLCRVRKDKVPTPAAVTTIVSSPLFLAICQRHGVKGVEVLTGFKYIGEKIHEWEGKHSPHFLFGAEESYGYLYGTHSRDKDAVVSCCLLAEIAEHLKEQGKTLVDFLYDLYDLYGIFREKLLSLDFPPSQAGMQAMHSLMLRLRKSPPPLLLEEKVVRLVDYLQKETTGLPASDVLALHGENGGRLIIRPSGTEPKIKIYASLREPSSLDKKAALAKADQKLDQLLEAFKKEILSPCTTA